MMNRWTYIRLLDRENKGAILRCSRRSWQVYKEGEWVETAIMIDYLTDISPLYDMYEKISEKEAEMIIGKEALSIPV